MPRPQIIPTPTDAEILEQRNVPPYMAAKYIGWGTSTLYRALQEGRAPFGFAVECDGHWSYNISPGLLTKYRAGDLPTYKLKEVQELAAEGIERILTEKLAGLKKLLDMVAA